MALLKQYKVNGKKVRFCDSNCADSFREDRRYGIIYPAVTDENGRLLSWIDAANERNFCAYCKRFPEDDDKCRYCDNLIEAGESHFDDDGKRYCEECFPGNQYTE